MFKPITQEYINDGSYKATAKPQEKVPTVPQEKVDSPSYSGEKASGGGAYVTQSTPAASAAKPFSFAAYQPSDAVKQANALLQQHVANRPGDYQSAWEDQMNRYLAQIQGRDPFQYDLYSDPLYQQYREQAVQLGTQGMMDTMGQAAALTGGYGNSYAQSAGQQTYQGYLQGLNDKIPDLYQMALQKYQMEGDDLASKYGMLADREAIDYGRYRDQMGDYNDQLNYLQGIYNNERAFDYGQYADNLAKAQWQAEFEENNRRYDQEWNAAQAKSSGGGVRYSDGDSDDGDADGGVDIEQEYMAIKKTANGLRDPYAQRDADEYLKGAVAAGLISMREATELRDKRY